MFYKKKFEKDTTFYYYNSNLLSNLNFTTYKSCSNYWFLNDVCSNLNFFFKVSKSWYIKVIFITRKLKTISLILFN